MDKRGQQRSRKGQMKRKRRRRRQKRILRALILTLMTVMALFVVILVLKIGSFFIDQKETGAIDFSWSFTSVDIVLDAGHGGKDQGASNGDVLEKDLTLEITEKTKDILKEAGYKVKLTREDDTFVELTERADYANRKKSTAFISIHCNSLEEGEADGIETFYAESKEAESQELAQMIQNCTSEKTGALDRGVKTADYVVIKETDMPAALVEVGFLSDAEECELLQQESYQEKIAEGIAAGIIEYLETTETK